MLLIYPPVARSTEPPPGLARLAGSLRAAGEPVRCLDLNQEGFDWLLGPDSGVAGNLTADTWTKGALARRERSLALLRDPAGYRNFDSYVRAVLDLNRVLKAAALATARTSVGAAARAEGSRGSVPFATLTMTDYQDTLLSPVKSADLLRSAREHEDNVFFPLFSRRIDETLAAFPARTVGISLVFLSQALVSFAIAGWLRAKHPKIGIVMGGGLVTSWVRQGRIDAGVGAGFGGLVDAFLPGPGEESLPGYLAGLTSASAAPGDSGNAPGSTSGAPFPAACPSYEDFPLDSYFSPGRTIPYSFSTGCPWKRCTFCPEKAEDNPFRGIPPAAAAGHLRELAARYSPRLFHFTDNEIAPAWLRALAAEPPGAPWYGFARFSRELTDSGFCRALARSGCVLLQLGLESGEQSVLDALGKGTRIEEIDTILVNLKAAGIGTYLYALFGTPAETRESALVTRDFLESRADRIGFINAAIFNMPASGEEARNHSTLSFYEGDLSLYCDFVHPAGWNRDAVRAFLKRDMGASPAIRSILARTPPLFTSNHAAFFVGANMDSPSWRAYNEPMTTGAGTGERA